jgi:hypothetical protein
VSSYNTTSDPKGKPPPRIVSNEEFPELKQNCPLGYGIIPV